MVIWNRLLPITSTTPLNKPKLVFVLRVSWKAMIPTRSCDMLPPGRLTPRPLRGHQELGRLFGGRRCMKTDGRHDGQRRPGVTPNPTPTFPPPPPPFISCRSAATLSGDTVMMTKTNKCESGGKRLHPAAPKDPGTPAATTPPLWSNESEG